MSASVEIDITVKCPNCHNGVRAGGPCSFCNGTGLTKDMQLIQCANMTWQELYDVKDPITVARRANITEPVDWDSIRSSLFKQALRRRLTREQVAEIDFANMSRKLMQDIRDEREKRAKAWGTKK